MSDLQSAQLYRSDHGAGKTALVFLHGTSGDHTDFNNQIREFESRYRIISYDLRGHGNSFRPASGYSIPELASDVASDLIRLELPSRSTYVIGHSLGGLVALELASQGLDALRGVILLDAPMLIPPHIQAAIAPYTEAFQSDQYKKKLEEFANAFYFSPTDDPIRKKTIIKRLLEFPRETFLQLWNTTAAYDAEAAVRRCRLAALYIHASVPADLEQLKRLSPFFSVVNTDRPSHFAQLECKDQVNAFIHAFIAESDRDR